jgi:hypothetical protein
MIPLPLDLLGVSYPYTKRNGSDDVYPIGIFRVMVGELTYMHD